MMAGGYVKETAHPEFPELRILNYTAQAQYERVWNPVARQCRGLIYNADTGDVLARPWPKFYNYGEHEEGEFHLDAPCYVQDKKDGSLGILYRRPDGYFALATRGSFSSDQATKGSAMLRVYIEQHEWQPFDGATYLFEIIYPENRIVLDYGGMEDLILLDVLETETGRRVTWDKTWPGDWTEDLPHSTLRHALAAAPRPNAEGLVVTFMDGRKIKLKQDDYVELHKLVTGLNERTVWERLMSGDETIPDGLPDEFFVWYENVAAFLCGEHLRLMNKTNDIYNDIIILISLNGMRDWERKDFAEQAKKYDGFTGWLFLRFDHRYDHLANSVWMSLKPSAHAVPRVFSEATA